MLIGILIGIIIWQFVVLTTVIVTNEDDEKIVAVGCLLPYLFLVLFVKPIYKRFDIENRRYYKRITFKDNDYFISFHDYRLERDDWGDFLKAEKIDISLEDISKRQLKRYPNKKIISRVADLGLTD